jgi:hypothetical protein
MSMSRPRLLAFLATPALAALLATLSGCTPKIGDKCVLNTDCSLQGNLVCDTSAPYGYCTLFNCIPDSCLDKAACVEFGGNVPGCPYDDYQSPARTGRTMCLQQCQKDSDCRTDQGYACVDPRQPPWDGIIVDDVQTQHVCLPTSDYDVDSGIIATYPDAAVCQSSGPTVPALDAGINLEEAGSEPADTGTDAPGGG